MFEIRYIPLVWRFLDVANRVRKHIVQAPCYYYLATHRVANLKFYQSEICYGCTDYQIKIHPALGCTTGMYTQMCDMCMEYEMEEFARWWTEHFVCHTDVLNGRWGCKPPDDEHDDDAGHSSAVAW